MSVEERGDSILTDMFRVFYHEVIHQKRLIQADFEPIQLEPNSPEEDNWADIGTETAIETAIETATATGTETTIETATVTGVDNEEGKTEYDANANIVWRKLLTILEKQSTEVGRMGGGFARELYKEAQFIMAALADEIFLHMEWSGKNVWQDNLLETQLFGSHAAGEIFFEKLDRLLQHREPIYRDLASVFFIALALGFQGKHRGDLENNWLDFYQKALFRFIFQKEPEFTKESKHFFEQAYAFKMQEKSGLQLANPRKWVFILGIFTIGVVIVSHGIWINLIEDLEQLLSQILLEGS